MKRALLALGILAALVGLVWLGGVMAQTKPDAGKGSPDSGQGKRGPPLESFEVCKGKKAGDACEFKRHDGETAKGTCAQAPDGGDLHCRPNDKPPQGDGDKGGKGRRGPPPESFEVCKGKKAGDACEFKRRDGDTVKGVCAQAPDGGEIHCRPNDKPPQNGGGSSSPAP